MPLELVQVLVGSSALGCFFLIYRSLFSWPACLLLLPSLSSLLLYTIWPQVEQFLLGAIPLAGEELSSAAAIAISLNSFFAMGSGFLLARLFPTGRTTQVLQCSSFENFAYAAFFVFLGIALLSFSLGHVFSNLSTYLDNVILSHNTASIPLAKLIIAVGAASYVLQHGMPYLQARRILSFSALPVLCFAGVPLFLAVYSSDKDPFLPLAGALVVVFAPYCRRIGFAAFLMIAVLGVHLLLSGLLAFSVYRGGGGKENFFELLQLNNCALPSITATDPGGPYISLSHAFNTGLPQVLVFSLEDSIRSVSPNILMPGGRPDALDMRYAKMVMPDFDIGKGLGFHPMAQGHMLLGQYGAWLYFPVLVFCALSLNRLCLCFLPWRVSQAVSLAQFSVMMISHRNSWEASMRALILYTTVIALSGLIAEALARFISLLHCNASLKQTNELLANKTILKPIS